MAVLQPSDIVYQGCVTGFDATVIGVNRLAGADFRLGEVDRLMFFYKQLDVIVQAGLVPLQRQNVIGPLADDLVCDLACDLTLTAHGIDRDHGSLDR
jgi:hypothetical protein